MIATNELAAWLPVLEERDSMLSARNKQGIVQAKAVTREDGPFHCLGCRTEVYVKKGSIIVHHFAHFPHSTCGYGPAEGELHKSIKDAICQGLALHPEVTGLQQERRDLEGVYPDICFYWGGICVVIEVQVSDLPTEIVQKRMQRYRELGIYVLWVLPWQEEIVEGGRYRMKDWVSFLHQLYFGHLYFFQAGEVVIPITLHALARGGGNYRWFESKEEWIAHGRPQRLKHHKGVHRHQPVNITAFYPRKRHAWKDCLAATLWMHKRGVKE